ncbi:MAG: mechanosensitive ion channel family protein [Calditrichaeota bacterium]|nr:mechanosensitive ion channel family protein [Calditrichota bacterium]RQW02660.1 MAG: mechanosensitive ion channel family protein [Calditrichota bacterium]
MEDKISNWIQDFTGLASHSQQKLFTSVAVIIVLIILRAIILSIVWRQTDDVQSRYRWRKTTTYVVVAIGFFLVIRVWFAGIQSLATFLGLITAGLAIALRDIVTSFAGWIFILWRRPFTVGDRIEIGKYRGDVIDIRVFKFSLMEIGNWVDSDQSTGRIVHVPNSLVLTDSLANYSQGFQFIWHEIPVLITFESHWEKAKTILLDIANTYALNLSAEAEKRIKEASKKFMVFYTALTPTVYTTVKDSGVLLTIRYMVEPRRRRGSEQEIWEAILRTFAENDDIDFAYPTTRFYDNRLEGKPGTRPPEEPS